MRSGEIELHPATELARGTETVVRVGVPPEAIREAELAVRIERVAGPDVVLSELRLFSSTPPRPVVTVVGDSRGGLIGSVAEPDGSGLSDAVVRIGGPPAAGVGCSLLYRLRAADSTPAQMRAATEGGPYGLVGAALRGGPRSHTQPLHPLQMRPLHRPASRPTKTTGLRVPGAGCASRAGGGVSSANSSTGTARYRAGEKHQRPRAGN